MNSPPAAPRGARGQRHPPDSRLSNSANLTLVLTSWRCAPSGSCILEPACRQHGFMTPPAHCIALGWSHSNAAAGLIDQQPCCTLTVSYEMDPLLLRAHRIAGVAMSLASPTLAIGTLSERFIHADLCGDFCGDCADFLWRVWRRIIIIRVRRGSVVCLGEHIKESG